MFEEDFEYDDCFGGISDDGSTRSSLSFQYEEDDFDDQSFHGISDDDDDDNTKSSFSLGYDDSDDNFGCSITTPAFVWKAAIKQRFAEFFQERYQAEAITSVEQFVTRHCLTDALQDDLLELLKLLDVKTIRPNSSVSSTVISSSATPEPIFPKSVESGFAQTCSSPVASSENIKPDSTACDIVVTSERPTETSITNIQLKRKLESNEEYPSKKVASEMVTENKDNGQIVSALCNMPSSSTKSPVMTTTPVQDTRHLALKVDSCQRVVDEGKIFCELCDVTISGEANVAIHNSGKRHLKNKDRQEKLVPKLRRSETTVTPKLWPCDLMISSTEHATFKLRNLYLEGEKNIDN